MVTRVLFIVLVLAVAVQRLFEVRKSQRNERQLRARGGREHAPGHFRVMQALHASWLVAMCVEVWWLERVADPLVAALAAIAFGLGQLLRLSAMRALRERWTVRIITLPGEAPVANGIYRHVRHPNYLGVVLEIGALPLVHGAVLTALLFSAANAALLAFRIRHEERALASDSDYSARLGALPRFVPRLSATRGEP